MVSLPQSLMLICKVGIKILHKVIRFKMNNYEMLAWCLGHREHAVNVSDDPGQNHCDNQ